MVLCLRHLCLGLAVAWLTSGPVHSVASQEPGSATPPAKKTKKADRPTRLSTVAPGGSGESAAERTARLRRECKGRPNAGACTGYTD